jgi:hypothetical protein
MNRPYTSRVEAYFERLAEVVRPRLASNGGPVILVQVENEYANVSKRYGEAGQEYLRWIVELGKRVGFAEVPQTTCEGGAAGAIETSNGFTISAERITAVRKSHPGTPLLWTELYPSWYRVWGGRNAPARDPREIAWAILDFVSRGGSGWNYYMWHGGSNFGRNSMYLQTPSYDFHAALDEYGRASQLGEYLGRFHAVMQEHSAILLQGERKEIFAGSERVTIWRKGKDELRLVQENYPGPMPEGTDLKRSTTLARLLNKEGKILFDLDAVNEQVTRSFINPKWNTVGERLSEWRTWKEPMPAERKDRGVIAVDPMEQLSLTKDSTDYCWYSCKLEVSQAGSQELVIPYGGDFFYAFVDGSLVSSSKLPLQEDRGAITPEDPAHPRIIANEIERDKVNGFRHALTLPSLAAGAHRLDLLAVALGMTKGDWQIASPMNFERKGVWEGVLLNSKPLQNWTMRTGLVGEKKILSAGNPDIRWDPVGELKTLSWYRTSVPVPEKLVGTSTAFRIDANGLGKGMIWVNGRAIGRHWLINASEPADEPSQRYYHVPADWLRATNDIVILEEQAASPAKVELQVRA